MFEENIVDIINYAIRTNSVNVVHFNNCIYCFYQFGQEQVGAVLDNGTVHGYRTNMIPDSVITNALIDYCKRYIGLID